MSYAHGLFDDAGGQTPRTLSKKGFGEALGLSPGRVTQLIEKGLPVEPNGRINLARGRDWYAANVDPTRRRATIDEPTTWTSAKAERDAAEARIATLKADRLAGLLIDRKAALDAIEARARTERDAWIGWVGRVAPRLATLTGGNLRAIVAELDASVRDQLASLASMPEAIPDD